MAQNFQSDHYPQQQQRNCEKSQTATSRPEELLPAPNSTQEQQAVVHVSTQNPLPAYDTIMPIAGGSAFGFETKRQKEITSEEFIQFYPT